LPFFAAFAALRETLFPVLFGLTSNYVIHLHAAVIYT